MTYIKLPLLLIIMTTFLSASTINGTTYKIKKIKYLINGSINTQTISGTAPLAISHETKYNGYHLTGSDYIFFHERYGNNPFKVQALDINGNPIGNRLIFPATKGTANGWDPGFEIGGPIGDYQHPWMGVIKASQFGVDKIYGLRQWATGADLKFYAIGTENFTSKDFGDAPVNYTHVSHKIDANLYLGNSVPDAEADQQSSTDATGDGADDSDSVIGSLPTGCEATDDIKLNPLNFNEGVVIEDAFKHTNVGKYKLYIIANNWSNIDEKEEDCIQGSSIISGNGNEKSGCNIESNSTVENTQYNDLNLTFEPYKFDISNFQVEHINTGNHYLYMIENNTTMGIRIKGDVIAKAYDDTTTTNFTTGCHASDVVVTFERNITNDGTSITPIIEINSTRVDDFNTTVQAEDSNQTAKGYSNIEILYNISKDVSNPINPVKLNLGDMNASSIEAKSDIATGKTRHLLNSTKNVEKNGKMSW